MATWSVAAAPGAPPYSALTMAGRSTAYSRARRTGRRPSGFPAAGLRSASSTPSNPSAERDTGIPADAAAVRVCGSTVHSSWSCPLRSESNAELALARYSTTIV